MNEFWILNIRQSKCCENDDEIKQALLHKKPSKESIEYTKDSVNDVFTLQVKEIASVMK